MDRNVIDEPPHLPDLTEEEWLLQGSREGDERAAESIVRRLGCELEHAYWLVIHHRTEKRGAEAVAKVVAAGWFSRRGR